MLITRKQKVIVEKYFVAFPNRSDKEYLNNEYDIKMFNIIDKGY